MDDFDADENMSFEESLNHDEMGPVTVETLQSIEQQINEQGGVPVWAVVQNLFVPTAHRIMQDAAAGLAKIARERSVWLGDLPTGDWLVRGETILSAKALRGLLQTAVKLSQPGETVRLFVETSGTHHRLIIDAFGRSLPEVCLPRFFQVLAIAEAAVPGGDLGLAAPLARRILRLFGGEVTVANREPAGVRFSVAFEPAKSAPAKPTPLTWSAGSPSAN